jgi:ribosomal protein S6
MKLYELNCLIKPNISGGFETEIRELIEKEKGMILDVKNLGEKAFYPEKRRLGNTACLLLFNFLLEPEKLQSLKEKFTHHPNILRFMILRKKESTAQAPLTKKIRKEKEEKKKVELKDIDKKIEEILDEKINL